MAQRPSSKNATNVASNNKNIPQNNNNFNSIKNSIKKNKGRNLTVEQQEYFIY